MTTYQRVLFGLGAVVLLMLVLELVRRHKLREEYTLFWLITCVVLLGLAIWQDALTLIAQVLGTVLLLSALFGIGFFLILLIMLHFSTVISDLWRQNKHLAKEISLLDLALHDLKQQPPRTTVANHSQERVVEGGKQSGDIK
jgi:hypothetical protein